MHVFAPLSHKVKKEAAKKRRPELLLCKQKCASIIMTLIHCFCWLNIERNNFHAAHNDLMATVITESNLMVDDSDELSSKIFTTFPSFLC